MEEKTSPAELEPYIELFHRHKGDIRAVFDALGEDPGCVKPYVKAVLYPRVQRGSPLYLARSPFSILGGWRTETSLRGFSCLVRSRLTSFPGDTSLVCLVLLPVIEGVHCCCFENDGLQEELLLYGKDSLGIACRHSKRVRTR